MAEERTVGIGHNSSGTAAKELRAYVERIERLMEEKAALATDIREVFLELKGRGFDPATTRRVIALRSMDPAVRLAEREQLDLYSEALGLDLV